MHEEGKKVSSTITIIKHGPIKVSGQFNLKGSDGKDLTPTELNEIYLCACGHSNNKPFCDGTHKKTIVK